MRTYLMGEGQVFTYLSLVLLQVGNVPPPIMRGHHKKIINLIYIVSGPIARSQGH